MNEQAGNSTAVWKSRKTKPTFSPASYCGTLGKVHNLQIGLGFLIYKIFSIKLLKELTENVMLIRRWRLKPIREQVGKKQEGKLGERQ